MLTAQELEQRRSYIGASDTSAIFNRNPFASAADIYWFKVHGMHPGGGNTSTQMGDLAEPMLVQYACDQLGVEVSKAPTFATSQEHATDFMAANLDGWGEPGAGIEAKYVGPTMLDGWGEPGTDDVPPHVLFQAQHQMYVADLSHVWVVAWLCRYNPTIEMYRVDRHEPLINAIIERDSRFWYDNVKAKNPPANVAPTLGTLERARRTDRAIALPVSLIRDWSLARRLRLDAKAHEDEMKRQLLGAMGDAGSAIATGGWACRMRESRPRKIDTAAIKAAGLYQQYSKVGVTLTLDDKSKPEESDDG